MTDRRILITGAAGFIGFHLAKRCLAEGYAVVGVDNLNDYYDPALKQARLAQLQQHPGFLFECMDIADRDAVPDLFSSHSFSAVVNLAAQAGVRYSLTNPLAYIDSNVLGFTNIIEGVRHHSVEHLIYASTSSVYGANTAQPFSEGDGTNHPLAIYAASKKANELIAHSYSHLYGIPTTGLRFFTVYGPWGRPDMALFLFTRAMLADQPIDVFNHGNMVRDFTYVDDIVTGIMRALATPATPCPDWNSDDPDPGTSQAPYRIYNIGNSRPIALMDYIRALESALGVEAKLHKLPMQDGDVPSTYADVSRLKQDLGYQPEVSITDGVAAFVDWYRSYYVTSQPA